MECTARIEEKAIAWLAQRDGADWNADDETQLQQWLEISDAHMVAFIRLEAGWEQTRRLKALGTGVPKGSVPPAGQWQLSPFFDQAPSGPSPPFDSVSDTEREMNKKPSRTRWLATAASALVASAAAAYYFIGLSSDDRYTTSLGVVAAVPMSDGSRVTLNTASEIRVAVSDTERKVELTKGEAFFEVAKDPTRPFVVEAGSKRIVAIGTQFSVRREGGDVEVAVTEGEVRVESAAREVRLAATRLESLTAGKVGRSNADGLLIENKELVDLQEQLAWRAGYLVFNETPLADAVAEFNRYSAEKIVIEDAAVAAYRVSGKFRSTSLEAFVRLLENAFPIEVLRDDVRIRLSSRE